jgi:hypothetical protein
MVNTGIALKVPVPKIKSPLPAPEASVMFPATVSELPPPSCLRRTRDVPLAPPIVKLPATAAVPDVILTSVALVEKTLSVLVGTVPRLQFAAVAHDAVFVPVKLLVWA